MSLTGTVKGAGLGGDPYRDGSYAYYVSEKVGTNDPKGIGAFLMASTEMENIQQREAGAWRHDSAGLMVQQPEATRRIRSTGLLPLQMERPEQQRVLPFGHIFRKFGAQTATLDSEPTLAALGRRRFTSSSILTFPRRIQCPTTCNQKMQRKLQIG